MISSLRRTLLLLCLAPVVVLVGHVVIFRVLPVPLTPLMVIRWTQDHPIDKEWVDLSEISPHMARAVIASEDNRFCEHTGVDWSAVKTVVNEYRDDGRLRGASTVSMQTAKNLYLWPGRSLVRKTLEAGLVHVLEWSWSKERIMEVYLNIVEMGPGVYGTQAAAQHHFGVDASELSLVQAAALVSILPDPLGRDPTRKNKAMGMRVQRIRQTMASLGPLLDCVPEAPIDKRARAIRKRSTGGGAPQHFQPMDAKPKNKATPQKPRRPKRKKVRTKHRRRPR
jgi:monofunctional biosynthetic peptidoglycan transglycosylase